MAKRNPWASQAHISSMLRYAPQREALAQLAREARERFTSSIEGAKSTSRLSQQTIQAAVPAVKGIYDRAQSTATTDQSSLAPLLASLGPAATGYRASAATEASLGADKLARERAAGETGLQSQLAAAAAAPNFARTLAQQQLIGTLGKLFTAQRGVASQEGLATSEEIARLEKESRGEALTKRGQDVSTANSERTQAGEERRSKRSLRYKEEHPSGAGGGTVGGVKQRTTGEQGKAATTLREIEHEARQARGEGQKPGQIYAELTQGHKGGNVVKRDEQGRVIKNSKGEVEYEAAPELKPYDGLLTQAAIDSVFNYGRVSKKTLEKLHKGGYSLAVLDLQGPAPASRRKARPRNAAAGVRGGAYAR